MDASCFVALYEGRKVGKGSNMSYVLVGKTETITHEPKYVPCIACLTYSPEFVKRFILYNKNQSIRFEVYETDGNKSNDISTDIFCVCLNSS